MTAAQYAIAYRAARASVSDLTLDTMRKLRRTYLDAAKMAAAELRRAELAGLGELTTRSWAQLEEALEAGARKIQASIDARLPLAMKDIAGNVTNIDEVYLVEALDRAGVDLDRAVVKNLFVDASDKVIRSLVNRVYTDGYSFSERIWRVGEAYQDTMKRVITEGLASGRDAVEVARDLEHFVRGDRAKLAQRWGDLTEGALDRRIGAAGVDYNALRLVRSELYMSLQDAAKMDGQINPACTGLYDWIRTGPDIWNCDCQELADGSPYTEDQIPDYPHPHCACQIRPRLMDGNEFIIDLKAWAGGADVGYLDEWNRDYYQKAAA
jgi:hypothetical protein